MDRRCAQAIPLLERLPTPFLDWALELCNAATPLEKALVAALSQRVQEARLVTRDEFDRWDDAFADAMRTVYSKFDNDQDVMALFIEAMMARTPWKMWDIKTKLPPPNADTYEAIEVCERAIQLADSTPSTIDLLLTDVVMPRMGGKDLAKHLSQKRPGIKVLFMSGYAESVVVHSGIVEPGVELLQKPFTATDLATRVRETLDAKILRKEDA